jgi:hypothetical protein
VSADLFGTVGRGATFGLGPAASIARAGWLWSVPPFIDASMLMPALVGVAGVATVVDEVGRDQLT